ncbi:MAG TPA: CarD family transcriptional regulator [Terriglobia bacterium]|jgi:CarD family transcriptional regulator|nr:CarD family transcriptional regulator [Terriglobia bacterium]
MHFTVGDKVVYPNQGVGTVEQISNRNLTGQAEMFYMLKLNSNGLRVMVPTSNVVNLGLRRVARVREVSAVLEYLDTGGMKTPHDWKDRFKENSEKMRSGSLLEVAEVFKTLLILSQAKPLSFREKRMFDRAWVLLVDEISIARGWAKDLVETQLVKSLSRSNLRMSLPS